MQRGQINLPLSCPSRDVLCAPLQSAQYLDNIETGTVLGPSSNADPDQVLSILLQGHLPRHSWDSARKKASEADSPGGRMTGGGGPSKTPEGLHWLPSFLSPSLGQNNILCWNMHSSWS